MRYELALYDSDLNLQIVQEATFLCIEHKLTVLSLPFYHLKIAKQYLDGTDTYLGCVVDAPYGFHSAEIHQNMIMGAVRKGAKVIELCINTGLINDGDYTELRKDIIAAIELCKIQKVDFRAIIDYKPWSTADFCTITEFLHRIGVPLIITATGRYLDDPTENVAISKYAIKNSGCNIIPASNLWQYKHIGYAESLKFDVIRFISLGCLKRCIIL